MIAYEYDYFKDSLTDRALFYNYFDILERIISETLNCKYNSSKSNYVCDNLLDYPTMTIINILTN